MPYTLQWNASIEQSLGKSQTVSISYVGANGRRLLSTQSIAHGFSYRRFCDLGCICRGWDKDQRWMLN
jgi:hypothetical protein